MCGHTLQLPQGDICKQLNRKPKVYQLIVSTVDGKRLGKVWRIFFDCKQDG